MKNEGRHTGFTTGNPDLVASFNPLGKYPEDWWDALVAGIGELTEGIDKSKKQVYYSVKFNTSRKSIDKNICYGTFLRTGVFIKI